MKVGKVTHYYDNIGVVIVKLTNPLQIGDKVRFKGHGADFEQEVSSLQVDHEQVDAASTGDTIGLKTEEKVREGTEVEKI